MFWLDKDDNNEPPGLTDGDYSLSPYIKILASPWGSNFFSAIPSNTTKNRMIIEKTITDVMAVVNIIVEFLKRLNMP